MVYEVITYYLQMFLLQIHEIIFNEYVTSSSTPPPQFKHHHPIPSLLTVTNSLFMISWFMRT